MSISQQIANLEAELEIAHIMAGNLLSATISDNLITETTTDAAVELIYTIKAEITKLKETKP